MEELIEILEEIVPDVDFRQEKHLVDDRILTSFQMVLLVTEIRDRLGVWIPPEEIVPENFQSAEDIYEMVERNRED